MDVVGVMLQALGDKIVSGETLYYDELLEMAQDAAYYVLDEAVAYEDTREVYERPDDIRDYIREAVFRLSQSEMRGLPEGFRKRYSGKLHLVVDKSEGASQRGSLPFRKLPRGADSYLFKPNLA